MKTDHVIIIGIMALLCVSFLSVPAASEGPVGMSSEIEVETGTTTDLGGGDYFYVRFGDDARFGVIWGTEDSPNDIYLVTLMSRYVGSATFINAQGVTLAKEKLVKVYTIQAVKLDSIFEFDDGNGNGVASYTRMFNPDTGSFSSYQPVSGGQDELVKRVDLSTAWERSEVENSEDNGTIIWTFSLTAYGLPYQALSNGVDTNVGNGVLDKVNLTFNLRVATEHSDDISVPQYEVTLRNSGYINKVQLRETAQFSGNITRYDVKWDKDIEGWDLDPSNEAPMLLMEYGLIVANHIPANDVPNINTWQLRHMIASMGEEGSMWANGWDEPMNGTTGPVSIQQQALNTNMLTFRGQSTDIARFEWVQTTMVNGEEEQVRAQVVAGRPIAAMNFRGSSFTGFIALMGMSFPAGGSIVQDPSISTEATTDLVSSSNLPVEGGSFLSENIGLIILGAVCAGGVTVGAIALTRRKGRNGPGTFDSKAKKDENDWSKYYDKK
ncbi:MAG: hypothetical protein HPY73_03845 [Methanomassiliicoccales archaeon]|nr:MAG: hypothetical protein HPY73_03845 [Methanomassiliicoccales archaeon]